MTSALKRLTLSAFAWLASLTVAVAADDSQRHVSLNKEGKLTYETDARGNRIPDFSHAGYRGGGVPIPDVAGRVNVSPADGDAGARIQAALNYVSTLPPDADGFRGAVLLAKGRYEVAGQLRITASGVVLRGSGSGTTGTVLGATGNGRRTLIELRGVNDRTTNGPARSVTSAYVPVNARTLELDSTEGLKRGDSVLVHRPSPASWIAFVGMNSVPGRPAPGWARDKMDVVWERRVESVEGSRVTLDAPLTCALEKEFGGARVAAIAWPGRLRNVGVENLRCESAWDRANAHDEEHSWMAVTLENVEDAWVRQLTATHFVSSAVSVWETSRRVTVEDCASLAPVSEVAGYRRHSFYTSGGQTLFLRCRAEQGRHDFAVGWLAPGPNAFVECEARDARDFSGPIESWATGVLYDGLVMDGGGLRFDNRELWDNGVGWAAANCVAWQCSVPVIIARTPPGARNWVIGCWAQFAGDALWRSPNEFVKPESLYAAQLAERVGNAAAEKALAGRIVGALPHPSPLPLGEGTAKDASRESNSNAVVPAPAGLSKTRTTIPPLPAGEGRGEGEGSEKSVANFSLTLEEVLRKNPALLAKPTAPPLKKLSLTNGWLTVDGRLLTGNQPGITWWRGHTQPGRAGEFGQNVTRFVPGRSGPGLTDNLAALTDDLAAKGSAGLRLHWGLWYDRRRDDHEMIRRVDADVWPPFFEQPWARTGTGRAWNGLSQFDLTRFNPWYFGRLREFAGLGAQKGLLCVNAMYFQHNILEAGAHWADFPWRSANNINVTGFPEPPPYAGKKRIFMAEEFYDVTHPVRRDLHRAYIRQCLANLADEPNVLHVLGEEYSGPLHFAQFWLDVVAEWRAETGRRVLIGLSAPRDVQDAILADAKRAAQVDVIDFKYWWQSPKGLFAPKGGQNLAPRQHEREFRGGRPTDETLAQMAAEYRAKFPGKAVTCDFSQAGWAFLCAGGSVANLPRTIDAKLLAAIPRMTPWRTDVATKQWSLRESGKQVLVFSGAKADIDLSGESGEFRVFAVHARTGQLIAQRETVRGGGKTTLSNGADSTHVFWLTKE